ncbi:MAG: Gfo/Idh/MocA family oxidoreductase [Parvularcula sp.]|jgi:predicted dehydrogenase|nr:Gfo/Idh/MocA family oxidoreductase [Parvularcula sp.]
MAELRVGLVGGGMVAAHHLAGWGHVDAARVVALAEPDPTRREARARAHDLIGYDSLSHMIAAERLNAVDIVAPVDHHAALVLEAVEAGLAVMCQKPLTPDVASADRLIAALPAGARVMLHENWRWRRPYRQLKAALASGEVGWPQRFDMRVESAGLLPDADGALPALRRQPFFATLERLIVFELLIHHLDVLEFLFGPVRILGATLEHRCDHVVGEDRAEIRLRAGDVEGCLVGDFMVPGSPVVQDRLWIDGGTAPVIDDWSLHLPGKAPVVTDRAGGYQDSYTRTISHFADRIRTGTEFETTVSLGRHLLDLVEHVYSAAKRN